MSTPGGFVIPQTDRERKCAPAYRGLLGYFPWALFQVAAHSFRSDRKHNPEVPESDAPHWRRGASSDHADCIIRHMMEMHTDPDYHKVAIAWRALALLQEHGERVHGVAPGSRSMFPDMSAEQPEMCAAAFDLSGRQCVDRGQVQSGDVLVYSAYPPRWKPVTVGSSLVGAPIGSWPHVYRVIACPVQGTR